MSDILSVSGSLMTEDSMYVRCFFYYFTYILSSVISEPDIVAQSTGYCLHGSTDNKQKEFVTATLDNNSSVLTTRGEPAHGEPAMSITQCAERPIHQRVFPWAQPDLTE